MQTKDKSSIATSEVNMTEASNKTTGEMLSCGIFGKDQKLRTSYKRWTFVRYPRIIDKENGVSLCGGQGYVQKICHSTKDGDLITDVPGGQTLRVIKCTGFFMQDVLLSTPEDCIEVAS